MARYSKVVAVQNWYVKIKGGSTHRFYSTSEGETENPLEIHDYFSYGDYYILDIDQEECRATKYDEFPEDDSFILVPKADILSVWTEIGSISIYGLASDQP